MAGYRQAVRDILLNDPEWQILAPGNSVHLFDDLGVNYLKPDDFTYRADGVEELIAVIKFGSASRAEIRAITEKYLFQIFYYSDEKSGWNEIDAASQIAIRVLQLRPIATDNRGYVGCRWISRSQQFFEPDLQNAAAQYDQFEMKLRRR